MRRIYRIELKRAFLSKRMLLALAVGIIICLVHFVQWLPVALQNLKISSNYTFSSFYPSNVYSEWICSNSYNWEQYVYFLMFPLIACIPYGSSLYDDWKGGYAKNIIIKEGKCNYFRAKWLSVFLSGGTAVVLPLVLNFMLYMLFLPLNTPELSTLYHTIGGQNILAPIFYDSPLIYVIIYLIIDFIFGGIMAGISLVMTNMTDKRLVVDLAPLFIYIFVYALCTLANNPYYSPVYFLNMDVERPNYLLMGVIALLMITLITVYVEYNGRKGELY